ncbi:protein misato homolog 1-like [Artemia franciscana]|uniref:Uncharacterized protein n=1 Tax=Artemia franciscana TaxID=6661 RepID=A0AA88HHQ5_ARTSF|nr:hypothetical protein QYM36_013024 [Artemia franciscana]KAK2709219.1 hypothetical protein QYM36_013024 [Artemia franciscana]KAK2709220.1 hypothetical protein QYM36_013024 [Artemia franciscana]
MGEIITLQIGGYSNHIGSHFWNIQEDNFIYKTDRKYQTTSSVNHDVLFQEGQTLQKETTYIPRLVCVDLKGGLGSMPQEGILYKGKDIGKTSYWEGKVEIHKGEKSQKNPYLLGLEEAEQKAFGKLSSPSNEKDFCSGDSDISSTTGNRNLESHIKVWTDYLRPHFHPKSILLTKEFEYQSPAKPFNFFDSGVLEWNKSYLGEDIEDSLRFFAEGCDVLQGFQLLFDAHDGFSGVAEKTLELIHEEYGKKTTHAFPVMPSRFSSDTQEKAKVRLINIALSFNSCIEHTFFTPLTLAKTYGLSAGKGVSYVNYIDSCDYHTSAIIASALDTLTLPYRLKNSNVRWEELLNLFSQSDRKLSTLNVQFPFVMNEDESLLELLGKSQEDVWTTLCPSSKSNAVFSQSIVFRGLQDSKRRRSLCVSNDHKMGLRRDESIEEAVQRCYLNKFPQTLNSIKVVDLPLKTSSPFPQFFVKSVSSTGYISNKERPGSEGVNSIPMGLSLQSGEACQSTLDILLQDIESFGLSNQLSHIRAKSFRTSFNLENDEWKEIMEKIDCYKGLYT